MLPDSKHATALGAGRSEKGDRCEIVVRSALIFYGTLAFASTIFDPEGLIRGPRGHPDSTTQGHDGKVSRHPADPFGVRLYIASCRSDTFLYNFSPKRVDKRR